MRLDYGCLDALIAIGKMSLSLLETSGKIYVGCVQLSQSSAVEKHWLNGYMVLSYRLQQSDASSEGILICKGCRKDG